MRFACSCADITEAVVRVVKACASSSPIPVMECIKISAGEGETVLSATDGEISITKKIKADVIEDGEICVPGKYFSDFLRRLDEDELTMSSDGKILTIYYGANRGAMQILPAADFPVIDTDISENSFVIETDTLKRIIEGTTFCCSTDDSRPILKGCQIKVYDDHLEMTALDGFRLATYSVKIRKSSGVFEMVCPARTLNEIARMLPQGEETTVYMQKNRVLVSVNDTVVTSRLYTGEFIEKNNIIPKGYETTVTCGREQAKAAVERVSTFLKIMNNNYVRFDISESGVKIHTRSEVGTVDDEFRDAQTEGKDLSIMMNTKYILDALTGLNEEKVEMKFNKSNQPFICRNTGNREGLYLILPVRMQNTD